MGLHRRSLDNGAVSPNKIADSRYANRYFKQAWPGGQLPLLTAAVGYGPPTGLDTDENLATFLGPTPMQALYRVNAAATALGPRFDTDGSLLASLDGAAAEGVEYVIGGSNTLLHNPFGVVVGANPDMEITLVQSAQTVANIAEMAVGFRKAEPFQALIDNYDEAAFVNMQAGAVVVETILNGGGTTTVDPSIAVTDGEQFTVSCKLVNGVPKFQVNGVDVGNGGFQFDAGEEILMFAHLLGITGASTWNWHSLEAGHSEDFNDSYIL